MGSFNLLTSPERSRIMSAIRGRGNVTTEGRLTHILRTMRISGWRRHLKLPGAPDFAFPASRVAVFVDGCFWHGCPRCYRAPRSNADFWREKIARNRVRDKRVARQLRYLGWSVLRIREHSLGNADSVAKRIRRALDRKKPSD